MSQPVISVDNLSKSYRLGQIGTGTITNDLKVWWAKARGKPNPLLKIGQQDYGNQDGETVWALKNVSFQVEQGEVLGIIGRNGAGKSTLLKILSRVTAPTSGQVKVKGRIASLLEVGTGFHPELTGRENIYLNGAILGMSRAEIARKFDEVVAFAEVEKFIDTPVKRYSSGMYVRLAFAVAAHLESEILIVDEVLAVGDAEFQKKCLGKMGDVAKEGRTVLFVSHNMAAIKNLCKKGILLKRGIIAYEDYIEKVVDAYLLVSNEKSGHLSIGLFDLSSRENSIQSNFPIIVKSVELGDEEGNRKESFLAGTAMKVAIRLENFNANSTRSIGIIFKNQYDQWITSFTTKMKCVYLNNPRSTNELAILRIEKIPLTPADYIIDVSIYEENFGRIDYVENAASFTITENDIYGNGFMMTQHFGLFSLDASFEVKNADH